MKLNQLKTFDDACKVEGLDPKKIIPDFNYYPEKHRKSMIAHAKLVIIVAAANRLANGGQEWTPDYSNRNEWKYESWFVKDAGSSGFRFGDDDGWGTGSVVGSRLCFMSREVARYVGTQFIDLYNEYLL